MEAVMEGVIQRFQINSCRPEEIIQSHWQQIVGEKNAKQSYPVRLDKKNYLTIAVSNPVIKQEMQFHRRMILSRLRGLSGCEGIQSIHFRAG